MKFKHDTSLILEATDVEIENRITSLKSRIEALSTYRNKLFGPTSTPVEKFFRPFSTQSFSNAEGRRYKEIVRLSAEITEDLEDLISRFNIQIENLQNPEGVKEEYGTGIDDLDFED